MLVLISMRKNESLIGAAPQIDSDACGSRETNSQLKEENRKLREVAEYRSAQLAHLAHELRTPLTSILGFAEILLSQEKLSDAQRNFCERIQNSAHQLQRNLNQLSDLARLAPAPDIAAKSKPKEK